MTNLVVLDQTGFSRHVFDRGVLPAMWEERELAGKVGHRDQLIIC